jgi:hypothetical protein
VQLRSEDVNVERRPVTNPDRDRDIQITDDEILVAVVLFMLFGRGADTRGGISELFDAPPRATALPAA